MSTDSHDHPRSRVPAIHRAAALLDALIDDGPLHLSELARRLGLPKSSVSNLCSAMAEVGWVRRTNEGFVLGARLVRYSQAYFGALDPAREFQSTCDTLADGLTYTTQLAMLGRDRSVTYIARREGTRGVSVASGLGQPLPAHCTGAGKALLAALPEPELERWIPLGPLAKLTAHSISDANTLREELVRTRRRGFAVDDEETLEGVYCIARALPAWGSVEQQLAVSVTLLKAHLINHEEERAVHDQLEVIFRELSLRLGTTTPPSPVT
jgi:IclR family transcriptional regulator, blcABC operon repressor